MIWKCVNVMSQLDRTFCQFHHLFQCSRKRLHRETANLKIGHSHLAQGKQSVHYGLGRRKFMAHGLSITDVWSFVMQVSGDVTTGQCSACTCGSWIELLVHRYIAYTGDTHVYIGEHVKFLTKPATNTGMYPSSANIGWSLHNLLSQLYQKTP